MTEGETDRQRQEDRQTGGLADRQTDIQVNGQTDKQAERRQTGRQPFTRTNQLKSCLHGGRVSLLVGHRSSKELPWYI